MQNSTHSQSRRYCRWDERTPSRFTVLNLRKELLYALDRTLGGPRDALIMMEERKIVVLAGNPTPETQSVTSHFAD
jgi:hypothetical protein